MKNIRKRLHTLYGVLACLPESFAKGTESATVRAYVDYALHMQAFTQAVKDLMYSILVEKNPDYERDLGYYVPETFLKAMEDWVDYSKSNNWSGPVKPIDDFYEAGSK